MRVVVFSPASHISNNLINLIIPKSHKVGLPANSNNQIIGRHKRVEEALFFLKRDQTLRLSSSLPLSSSQVSLLLGVIG